MAPSEVLESNSVVRVASPGSGRRGGGGSLQPFLSVQVIGG